MLARFPPAASYATLNVNFEAFVAMEEAKAWVVRTFIRADLTPAPAVAKVTLIHGVEGARLGFIIEAAADQDSVVGVKFAGAYYHDDEDGNVLPIEDRQRALEHYGALRQDFVARVAGLVS